MHNSQKQQIKFFISTLGLHISYVTWRNQNQNSSKGGTDPKIENFLVTLCDELGKVEKYILEEKISKKSYSC